MRSIRCILISIVFVMSISGALLAQGSGSTKPIRFAAIAYSQLTNRWGMSWQKFSRWEAEATAVQSCGAVNCAAVVWVQDACVSISVSDGDHQAGWAFASTQYDAQNQALNSCFQTGARYCQHTASVCAHNF